MGRDRRSQRALGAGWRGMYYADGPVRSFRSTQPHDPASKACRQILYSPLQVLRLLGTKPQESDALAVGGVVRQPPLDGSSEERLCW